MIVGASSEPLLTQCTGTDHPWSRHLAAFQSHLGRGRAQGEEEEEGGRGGEGKKGRGWKSYNISGFCFSKQILQWRLLCAHALLTCEAVGAQVKVFFNVHVTVPPAMDDCFTSITLYLHNLR